LTDHISQNKEVLMFGKTQLKVIRRASLALALVALVAAGFWAFPSSGLAPEGRAFAAGNPSITVISPVEGATITTTDIPAQVEVSDFNISAADVGLPDKPGEGHIHVMLDGMNMGVLFNFYTTPNFTLPGDGIMPGEHTLIFDLATNTHMDMADTVKEVKINYQPTNPKPAPPAANVSGPAAVQIVSPADGASVGPKFTIEVKPTNFTPSESLEGKHNTAGYGHYHVIVDMPMGMGTGETGGGMSGGQSQSGQSGQGAMSMMSMDGMVGMPGSNTIPLDLSAWANGKHTIVVEPVQNDHTPVQGAKEAMITINLQGSSGTGTMEANMGGTSGSMAETGSMGSKSGNLPQTGNGDTMPIISLLALAAVVLGGAGLLLRRKRA
jgi:LPXTG-motif cell wall-anchored protein